MIVGRRLLVGSLVGLVVGAGIVILRVRPWARPASRTTTARKGPDQALLEGVRPEVPLMPRADADEDDDEDPGGWIPGHTGDWLREEPTLGPDDGDVVAKGSLRWAKGDAVPGTVLVLFDAKEDGLTAKGLAHDGVLDVRAHRAGSYKVFAVRFADESKYPLALPDVEIAAGASVALTLDDPKPAVLLVRDRGGAALANARAFRAGDVSRPEELLVPPREVRETTPVSGDATGRIEIPASWDKSAWFVTAPGSAWALAEVSHDEPEPSTVVLRPGGSLRVFLPECPDGTRADISASRGTCGEEGYEAAYLPVPREGTSLTYDALPVGRWTLVAVEDAAGTREVEIVRGATAEARFEKSSSMDTRPRAPSSHGPLRGTIRVPKSWGLKELRLSWRLVEPSSPARGGRWFEAVPPDGRVEIEIGDVPAGGYLLRVDAVNWSTTVTVTASGQPFDLQPPEAGEVEIVVTDAETGNAVDGASVRWIGMERPSLGPPDAPAGPSMDEEDLPLRLMAGDTSLAVRVQADGYLETYSHAVAVAGKRTQVEVPLFPAAVLVVKVRGDRLEQEIDRLPLVRVSRESQDEEGGTHEEEELAVDGVVRFAHLQGGHWRVTLMRFPADSDVAPALATREVDLHPRETAELVIDVPRAK